MIFHLTAIISVFLSSTIPFLIKINGRLLVEKMGVPLENSMSSAKYVFDFCAHVNMNSEVVRRHIFFAPLQYIPLFPKILRGSFRYIDTIRISDVSHHSDPLKNMSKMPFSDNPGNNDSDNIDLKLIQKSKFLLKNQNSPPRHSLGYFT